MSRDQKTFKEEDGFYYFVSGLTVVTSGGSFPCVRNFESLQQKTLADIKGRKENGRRKTVYDA